MIDRIFSKMMDILSEEQINCDRYGYVFNANNYEWRVGRHVAREFELYLSKTGIARRKDEKAVAYGIDVSIDTAATDKVELWRKVGGIRNENI